MKREGPCTENDTLEGWTSKNSSCTHVRAIYTQNTQLLPLLYIVKLGFTGVFIFFLTFALNHRLWVLHSSVVRASAV